MPLKAKSPSDPLQTPVQYVKGVGPHLAQLLQKKGVTTAYDLFYYFPHRYLDRRKIDPIRNLRPGKEKCVVGEVVGIGTRPLGRSRKRICEMVVSDNTGVIVIVWFHFNEKYLKKKYQAGNKVLIFGECQMFGAQKQFVHPDIEDWDEDSGQSDLPIVPVYPLTDGLYQKTIRKIISNALGSYLKFLKESPLTVRSSGKTEVTLQEALAKIHHPPP